MEPCQRVLKSFRTYHHAGNSSCGEALDDCNERANSEYTRIKKPTPGSILRFAENLDLYRDNERELMDLCGVKARKSSKSKDMTETIDLLVNAFKRGFGSSRLELTHSRVRSVLADGASGPIFKQTLAGSSKLFAGKSSYSELRAYVTSMLVKKDGLFHDPKAAEAEASEDDDGEGPGHKSSDESSDSEPGDSLPLHQGIKMRKTAWLKKHKPRPGESLEDYQRRVSWLLQSGIKGDGSVFKVPPPCAVETLQMAADVYESEQPSNERAPKISKLLEKREIGGHVQYLVRYVQHRGCEKRPDQWIGHLLLCNAAALIQAFDKMTAVETGTHFEVEYIYGKRIEADVVQYHVKWKGFAKSSKYWEPSSNLVGAHLLIDQFNDGANPKPSRKRRKTDSSSSDSD